MDLPYNLRYGRCTELEGEVCPRKWNELRLASSAIAQSEFAMRPNLSRSSLSSFVMDAAAERAERVIADHADTTVGRKFFEEMLRLLDEPGKEISSLKKAASRSKVVRKRNS